MKALTADHKYLTIARGIEALISAETLRTGDKLPSVRSLADEHNISMGTAFQAYYHLEGKGLIESRPKSGYYVRFNHKRLPSLPAAARPDAQQHTVTVKDLITEIYGDIAAPVQHNFALGVPDAALLPTAKLQKSFVQALRQTPHHATAYEHTQGNPELRTQIAKHALHWGGKVRPDEVVITNGCLDAVVTCLKAVTQPGDTVAVECPTYFGIYQAIESLGLQVVEIASDPVQGLSLPNLEAALKKRKLKAVVCTPNFNNPQGSLMPDTAKKELVALCARHRLPLIEDDIYGELFFGKTRPRPCAAFDKEGWVLHCSSFSKSLAPGYRIGWVLPGRFGAEVRQLKRIQNISAPTPTQAALAHFLQHGRYDFHLKRLRTALHTQCLRYSGAVAEHFPAGTRISRPAGGLVLWLQLPAGVDLLRLRREALRQRTAIVPGTIFSAATDFAHCLRLSFGKPWSAEVEAGLKGLGVLVGRLCG